MKQIIISDLTSLFIAWCIFNALIIYAGVDLQIAFGSSTAAALAVLVQIVSWINKGAQK